MEDPNFKDFKFHIFSLFPFSNLLALNVDNESRIGKLSQRLMKKDSNCDYPGIVEADGADMDQLQQAMKLFERYFENTNGAQQSTFVVETALIKTFILQGACIIEYSEKWMRSAYVARESFANGLIVSVFNGQTDIELVKLFTYRMRTFIEVGLEKDIVSSFGLEAAKLI